MADFDAVPLLPSQERRLIGGNAYLRDKIPLPCIMLFEEGGKSVPTSLFSVPTYPPKLEKKGAGQVASNKGALLADGDQTSEKLRLFRDKLSSNVAALPILLKRMTECISKIDNLDSENIIIHPAFKKKRTS
ncbi:hypothetical protein L3X38_013477 [Prunus dulcis]|uniref:Uncharacterized protein n=1 Tax=Prunus dulcis TaxID=3755 RepID=A0AAD4WLE2_PRUDU|nr:hypothetical protein L3X38_013477 [Prunus dulcis]